jgi:hypothetical protein
MQIMNWRSEITRHTMPALEPVALRSSGHPARFDRGAAWRGRPVAAPLRMERG